MLNIGTGKESSVNELYALVASASASDLVPASGGRRGRARCSGARWTRRGRACISGGNRGRLSQTGVSGVVDHVRRSKR